MAGGDKNSQEKYLPTSMKWLTKLFGGDKILNEVANVVDRFVDTKDDKRAFFKEVYQLRSADRAGARRLYGGANNGMQKVYAFTFLIAYIALTAWLIYSIVHGKIEHISQFETGLIGSIWGGMTAKVNTITDFFFGSSEKTQEINFTKNKNRRR